MRKVIKRLMADRCGGIVMEYALAAGLVGVVTALGLAALGDALDQSYEPVTVVTSQAYELSNQRGSEGHRANTSGQEPSPRGPARRKV
jgi:Flp pilus assembly pilin Flp